MNTADAFLADVTLMDHSPNNATILANATATMALMGISVTDARTIFTTSLVADAHRAIVTLRVLSTIGNSLLSFNI